MVVLSSVRTGNCVALTVTLSSFESTGVAPNNACPFAVFVTKPAFRSVCVTAYVAVQSIEAPTARLMSFGQVTLALSSVTVKSPARVTLPVFLRL